MVQSRSAGFFAGAGNVANLQPDAKSIARSERRPAAEGASRFATLLAEAGSSGTGKNMTASTFPAQSQPGEFTSAMRQNFAPVSTSMTFGAPAGSTATSPGGVQVPAQGAASSARRSSSRLQAHSAMQGHLSSEGGRLGQTSKKNTRIGAGVPITGRSSIGMEDGRMRAPSLGGSTLAQRPAMNASAAIAAVAREGAGQTNRPGSAQASGRGVPGVAGAEIGYSMYTNMMYGGSLNFEYGSLAHGGRDMTALARALESSDKPLKTLNSFPGGRSAGATGQIHFPDREEGAMLAVMTASHRRNGKVGTSGSGEALKTGMSAPLTTTLGNLAAKFESGQEGIAAIGYDRHGGTSYGKFQLSSRAGTMTRFIEYLDEKAPDIAKKLSQSGPANTGKKTGKMPEAWKAIAMAEPERFEELQNDFIRKSHFEPALRGISDNTGISFDTMPPVLQEVAFSTAVQHGPSGATRIISRAINRVGVGKLQEHEHSPEKFKQAGKELIKHIYSIRSGQFVSSTERVQAAAKNRLNSEMREALGMFT